MHFVTDGLNLSMQTKTLILLCCILSANAFADLLPPGTRELAERYSKNPGAFDRTDAWCEGHGIGDSCVMPGNAFEGGGPGQCDRVVHKQDIQIDLRCVLKPQPHIERAIPNGPWQVGGGRLCENGIPNKEMAEELRNNGWVCEEPPVVTDRFCKGIAAGQPCVVEVRLDDRSESAKGICVQQIETSGRGYGGRTFTRPVLTCQPEQPAPTVALKPVSAWRKLFQ